MLDLATKKDLNAAIRRSTLLMTIWIMPGFGSLLFIMPNLLNR